MRDDISDDHQVARHCTRKDFTDDGMTELESRTFEPTETNPEISVNWLEFYQDQFDELGDRINAICQDMSAERAVRANHKLALLRVGEIKKNGYACDCELDVAPDGYEGNESHAVISGIPVDNMIVHKELADAASMNLVDAIPHKKKG